MTSFLTVSEIKTTRLKVSLFFCFLILSLLLLHPPHLRRNKKLLFPAAVMDSPGMCFPSHPIFPPSSSGTLLLHRLRLPFFCSFLFVSLLGYNHTQISHLKTNLLCWLAFNSFFPSITAQLESLLPHWIPTCQSVDQF